MDQSLAVGLLMIAIIYAALIAIAFITAPHCDPAEEEIDDTETQIGRPL